MGIKASSRSGTRFIISRNKAVVGAVVSAVLLSATGTAAASTITGTIDTSSTYSSANQSTDGSTFYSAPSAPGESFPAPAVIIGGFDVSSLIASGESIVGATLSGDFGSDILGSATSQVNLFLNGVEVASCDASCELASESSDVIWTYTFTASDLASLASGKGLLSGVQMSASQIVLDPTRFTIQTAAVPLPGAAVLLGSGLFSLLGLRRRKAIPA